MRSLIPFFITAALLPAQSQQVQAALAAGSYFPLEVGNRWVYRMDDRIGTTNYQTWTVDRIEERSGQPYFVVAIHSRDRLIGETLFRVDIQGRIFVHTGAGDLLFLDAVDSSENAQLKIQSKGPFGAPIGSFADTLTYRNSISPFVREAGTLGRGIGLLTSRSDLLTGSSGGFSEGRTLVEAVIGGRLQFALASAGVQLGLESLSLDLTGKQTDNCVVPCYFAACGVAFPIPDPPGTYKPCVRARVGLTNWPADASRHVRVQLLSPGGDVLIDQSVTVASAPGEAAAFTQLRLYSQPNEVFPPGAYRLTAATEDGSAESAVTVRIK